MSFTLAELLEFHRNAVEATDAAADRQDEFRKSVEDALRGRHYRANAGGGSGTYVIERVTDHVRLTVYGRKQRTDGKPGSQVWDLGEFVPAHLVALPTAEREAK